MSAGHLFIVRPLPAAIIAVLIVLGLFSCKAPVIVKKYQPGKPFVYQANIKVNGNFTNEEKERLASRLKSQLDDSMRSRAVSKVFWSVMKNPPVYDSLNADKSILFMRALLISSGYFGDTINYKANTDTVNKNQYRTTINYSVTPGKLVRIDSFAYNIKNAELQKIALANQKDAALKKGEPFAKSNISVELDRLVVLFRNNGYMRFGREYLYGLWDTLDISLLRPSLDPFEQLEILQKIKERKENPKANLEIRLRPGTDSSKLRKYYVGNVIIYPDYTLDTISKKRKEEIVKGVKVISYQDMFNARILPQNIALHHGDLYDQRNYFNTINQFNKLGAWRLVTIEQNIRSGQDTSDFVVKLTPAVKYSFTTNFEASQNQTIVSGNLFGLGVNAGVQNRNFARAAIQATTNIRYGVELGNQFVQSQQASFSHNIYFPKAIPAVKWIPERNRNNIRTIFSFNAANTDRKDLYRLSTVNASWGYEYLRNIPGTTKQIQLSWKIPNIEYSTLNKRDSLQRLIDRNPALKNIFTDGFISSTILAVTFTNTKEKTPHILSASLELPFIAGLIPSQFLDKELYKYIKINTEYTKLLKIKKSSFVFRGFAGVGYALNSTVNPQKKNALPFFKQYFAGGPNSMRAWRLRRIGAGSVVKDFGENPDRFGDVQLEVNAEYRFKLATIAGTKIESAFFTDMGNVWFLKKNAGSPEEVFNINRLGKDLAIGVGTGIRIDFSFFLIRLDYAYKAKDPSPDPTNAASQNKWFYDWRLLKGQLQLGINYPFKL